MAAPIVCCSSMNISMKRLISVGNVCRQTNVFLRTPDARNLQTTVTNKCIQKMARLRVVDNSALGKQAMLEGKPPKCIHVYNKTGHGTIGDKVMVAIKGQKKRGYIVGVKQIQKHMVPRFDTNNLVLIDDTGSPLGTRIHAPLPAILRGKALKGDFAKIVAIATRFV